MKYDFTVKDIKGYANEKAIVCKNNETYDYIVSELLKNGFAVNPSDDEVYEKEGQFIYNVWKSVKVSY